MTGQYLKTTMDEVRSTSNSARVSELRVAVVSDAAPHRNGVGAYYHDLQQHLIEQISEMEMIGPVIKNNRWRGGIALPLPGDSTQKFLVPNPFRLWRKLKKIDPQVVIIPTPGLFGMVGAMMAKIMGARVIIGFHTWYEKLTELYWSRWQGWLTKGYFDVSNKIVFYFGEQIVVNSEFMAETAGSISRKPTTVVGTPVSYDFIKHPVTEPTGKLQNVLFAGRLAAEKNLESIIEAAEHLPHIQFNIAGDGPERELVISATQRLPNLNYLGWMNREHLLTAIDEHDILILPSHVESFGTIALEAMARKRLALVSVHCGIAHWPDLQTGLFHIHSDENLTQALVRLESLPEENRLNVAAEARRVSVTLNDWNLKQWLNILSS